MSCTSFLFPNHVSLSSLQGIQTIGLEELAVLCNSSGVPFRPPAGLPVRPFSVPALPGSTHTLNHTAVECVRRVAGLSSLTCLSPTDDGTLGLGEAAHLLCWRNQCAQVKPAITTHSLGYILHVNIEHQFMYHCQSTSTLNRFSNTTAQCP